MQLYGPFKDPEGNLCFPPVYRDGPPVESQEAAARRDRLIEKPASLTPVPGALDQVTQCFGTDTAAEVPGRSRRVVRKGDRWPKTEPVRPTLPKPRPLWTTSYGSLSSPIVAFGFEFARVPLLPAYALMPGEHVVGRTQLEVVTGLVTPSLRQKLLMGAALDDLVFRKNDSGWRS